MKEYRLIKPLPVKDPRIDTKIWLGCTFKYLETVNNYVIYRGYKPHPNEGSNHYYGWYMEITEEMITGIHKNYFEEV